MLSPSPSPKSPCSNHQIFARSDHKAKPAVATALAKLLLGQFWFSQVHGMYWSSGHIAMAINLMTGYIGNRLCELLGREATEETGLMFTLSRVFISSSVNLGNKQILIWIK